MNGLNDSLHIVLKNFSKRVPMTRIGVRGPVSGSNHGGHLISSVLLCKTNGPLLLVVVYWRLDLPTICPGTPPSTESAPAEPVTSPTVDLSKIITSVAVCVDRRRGTRCRMIDSREEREKAGPSEILGKVGSGSGVGRCGPGAWSRPFSSAPARLRYSTE